MAIFKSTGIQSEGHCETHWVSLLEHLHLIVNALVEQTLDALSKEASSQLTGHGAGFAAKLGVVFVRAVPAIVIKI